jgi:hypothetical protein
MVDTPRFCVRITKPHDASFGELMNRLRTWLDLMKIQPKAFRSFADHSVEIVFRHEHDAVAFKTKFPWELSVSDGSP